MYARVNTFKKKKQNSFLGLIRTTEEDLKTCLDLGKNLVYTPYMPNVRAPGQKPILIPLTNGFLDAIDLAYRNAGFDDRAKFIREAVREKLVSLGIDVPVEITLAPGRRRPANKCEAPDRVKKKYPRHNPNTAGLNEGERGEA